MHVVDALRHGCFKRRVALLALSFLFAGVLLVAAALAALPAGACAAGPRPAAAGARPAAPGLEAAPAPRAGVSAGIVVVRRVHGRDSLWMVSPSDAGAAKLADLPVRPARMVASPDGAKVAIQPATVSGTIYVLNVSRAKLVALSLAALGVKQIDGFTWLSATRLLVSGSGSSQPTSYPLADRLYTVTTSGGTGSFRGLHGSEPSAAPAAHSLVYTRLRDGGADSADPGARFVVEDLMSLKLVAGSTPHVIGHARYVNSFDIRRYRDPGVSPDGKYVMTSTTGSDISATYTVRAVATGKALRTKSTALAGRDVVAWSLTGDEVAFWGMPPAQSGAVADVYVYSAASKVLTARGPLANVAVTGLSWAPDGALLAYGLHGLNDAPDQGHLWTAAPGNAGTPTDLGQGSLPVWLP